MALRKSSAKLETRLRREKLKLRQEPYWVSLSEGCSFGYKKRSRNGIWLVRRHHRSAHPPSRQIRLGLADDSVDADGVRVLNYRHAWNMAKRWCDDEMSRIRGGLSRSTYRVSDVSKLIEECVSFWANEMHVDGFRFDLGSILAVDQNRNVLKYPPLVWAIDLDPTLAGVKVIAEPFGASEPLVGSFPDIRWSTWNYLYRDAIRRFVRGDPGIVGEVATRVAVSSDIYGTLGQKPVNGGLLCELP